MQKEITIYDRIQKKTIKEKIVAKKALFLLYGEGILSKIFSFFLLPFIAKLKLTSKIYGFIQRLTFTKKYVKTFVKKYSISTDEFEKNINDFSSFNDFFIRKLKKEKRPFSLDQNTIIAPADGRYLAFEDISKEDGFYVKGKKFSLKEFLQNDKLASKFENASMLIARLSPVDYHRFHFPFDCIPQEAELINGNLYSVNPIALQKRPFIFSENKRMITHLHSEIFSEVLFIEVGATYVGSICQTFFANRSYKKADEKGYFSFGGSTIVVLFKNGTIKFSEDLLKYSKEKIETRCLFGQIIGSLM